MLDAVLGAGVTGAGSVPSEEQVRALPQQACYWCDCDGVSPGGLLGWLKESERAFKQRGCWD